MTLEGTDKKGLLTGVQNLSWMVCRTRAWQDSWVDKWPQEPGWVLGVPSALGLCRWQEGSLQVTLCQKRLNCSFTSPFLFQLRLSRAGTVFEDPQPKFLSRARFPPVPGTP